MTKRSSDQAIGGQTIGDGWHPRTEAEKHALAEWIATVGSARNDLSEGDTPQSVMEGLRQTMAKMTTKMQK